MQQSENMKTNVKWLLYISLPISLNFRYSLDQTRSRMTMFGRFWQARTFFYQKYKYKTALLHKSH